jgi:hypothetical protein
MRRTLLVALCTALAAAASPKEANGGSKSYSSYSVAVVQGDGAVNDLAGRSLQAPVVHVVDGSGKPVLGARVEFDAPKAGPGAVFSGGSTHYATTTNANGVAKAYGLLNNGVAGTFSLLVRVSYGGQTISELTLHQTNATSTMTHLATNTRKQQEPFPDASLSPSVVGVAMGDEFQVNGLSTPANATLTPGNRVQTQESAVTIYIHEHCEFLVGPHSAVIVQPHQVSVMSGAVRAKHFGDCKFGYGGLWVTSPAPNGDAVVALSNEHMEVGSVSGPVEIANELRVVSTVDPGTVSEFSFAPSTAASGAKANAPPSRKVIFMLGVGTGAALVGLGLAAAAIERSSAKPTSP